MVQASTVKSCLEAGDVEGCAKAYATEQATIACEAGVAAYTAGAGAVVGAAACEYLVPIVVEQVWRVVWPICSSVWSGAAQVVEGFGSALGGLADAIMGGGVPFDRYHAIVDTWAGADAALADLSSVGLAQVVEMSNRLGVSPGLAGIGPVFRPIGGAQWNAAKVWRDALASSALWSGGFDLAAESPGVPGFGGGGHHAIRFWGRAETAKGWSPGAWGVVNPTAFSPMDLPAFYALAQQGWALRASAIPDAVLSAGTAIVMRRAQGEQTQARARAARVGLVLGVAGLATAGASVYRLSKGRWPWSGK